ncbi:DUF2459 domain-containing protein [Salinibacter grassmerensis]|uniref:DUF2459 domain-containing protein n=1 Tax=Salinibacter grassmerensis TaxID=3040353 RepID=UPI0021E97591|nr:DUF2459 domain-containing protein [Salinibacter grassmerensis]
MQWWRGLLFGAVAAWLVVLAARCHLPRQTVSSAEGQENTSAIYVVQHGWHAGIAIRRADVSDGRWSVLNDFASARYVEVGWGEAQYYPGASRGVWGVLRAGAWPTGSVVHVVPIDRPVPDRFSGRTVVRVLVSPAELDALTAFVAESFAVDSTGRASTAAPGYYAGSRFYASPLAYHVFNNCNHWAAAALEAAGCDVSPRWVFTVGQVVRQAKACGALVQSGGQE